MYTNTYTNAYKNQKNQYSLSIIIHMICKIFLHLKQTYLAPDKRSGERYPKHTLFGIFTFSLLVSIPRTKAIHVLDNSSLLSTIQIRRASSKDKTTKAEDFVNKARDTSCLKLIIRHTHTNTYIHAYKNQ